MALLSSAPAFNLDDYRGVLKRLANIENDRDELLEYCLQYHEGSVMDYELADTFGHDAAAMLNLVGASRAITGTARLREGTVMDRKQWRRLCWQISANQVEMLDGVILAPSFAMAAKQWVVLEVVGFGNSLDKFTKLEFRAVSGNPAGMAMLQELSEAHLQFIARELGFRGRSPWYRFDGNQLRLVGLYFIGFVEEMRVQRFVCEGELLGFNRKVIRWRYRHDGSAPYELNAAGEPKKPPSHIGCPDGLEHSCPECHLKRKDCIAGY